MTSTQAVIALLSVCLVCAMGYIYVLQRASVHMINSPQVPSRQRLNYTRNTLISATLFQTVIPTDTVKSQNGTRSETPYTNVFVGVVESRFCEPGSSSHQTNEFKMRKSAAALNLHYAEIHGYEFVMFCDLKMVNGTAEAWAKPLAMKHLMKLAKNRTEPSYIVLLDSDAYIRAMYTRLDDYMTRQHAGLAEASWSIFVSREDIVGPMTHKHHINTGMLYGYVDPTDDARYKRAILALDEWTQASCNICENLFKRYHPWEQGCLEVLLGLEPANATQNPVVAAGITVSTMHMNTWNGPWGAFARHIWGGPGKEMRAYAFDNEITTFRLDVERSFELIRKSLTGPQLLFDVCQV